MTPHTGPTAETALADADQNPEVSVNEGDFQLCPDSVSNLNLDGFWPNFWKKRYLLFRSEVHSLGPDSIRTGYDFDGATQAGGYC